MEQNKELLPEVYLQLLKKFIEHQINVERFEKDFLSIWRYHRDANIRYMPDVEAIISTLMLDVDHYCEPALANYDKSCIGYNITEKELHICAKQALEKLEQL